MKGRVAPLGIGLLMAAVLGAALAATVSAQETTGQIAGRVVNGTAGARSVAGTEVSLHVFREGELIDTRTIVPDPQGRFAFQGVPTQGEPLYVLSAVYLDIQYSIELTGESELGNVLLTVYESTGSLDSISVRGSSMFIMRVNARTRAISAFEIVTVANEGDRTFVPDLTESPPMNFLRFPVPPGTVNLEVESELPDGQLLQVDRGFALVTPVPPGEYGVAFTYLILYSGEKIDLSRRFGTGSRTFRLLVSEKVASVETSDLADLGLTAIGDTTYQIFSATDIEREGRIAVALTSLPQPSLWQRVKEWFGLDSVAVVVSVVLAISLATLLLLGLLRRLPVRSVESMEDMESAGLDRPALTQAIAVLDDRFQRGEVDERRYGRQRQELKAHALSLVWREERA